MEYSVKINHNTVIAHKQQWETLFTVFCKNPIASCGKVEVKLHNILHASEIGSSIHEGGRSYGVRACPNNQKLTPSLLIKQSALIHRLGPITFLQWMQQEQELANNSHVQQTCKHHDYDLRETFRPIYPHRMNAKKCWQKPRKQKLKCCIGKPCNINWSITFGQWHLDFEQIN